MKLIKREDAQILSNKIYLGSGNNRDYYLESYSWILTVYSAAGKRRRMHLPMGFKRPIQAKDDEYLELAVEKAKRLLILK
jgi:hypothetical protein